jgi:hypothetical protein
MIVTKQSYKQTKQMYRFPENFTKEQIVKFYNTKIKYLNKELKKSKSNEFTKVILNKINEHYNELETITN